MIDGYPVVDLRRNKDASLLSVIDELQHVTVFLLDVYVAFNSISKLNLIAKCLRDNGRNPVVYHPYIRAEEETGKSLTEEEMKQWLKDPKDKDLVTTLDMARGWEASTVVAILHIQDDELDQIGNPVMRAVSKARV